MFSKSTYSYCQLKRIITWLFSLLKSKIKLCINELDKLIEDVKKISQKEQLSSDDEEQLNCNLEVISEELKSKQPRKSFIKTAVEGMKMIKGTAEFGAAITTLIQFVLGCI